MHEDSELNLFKIKDPIELALSYITKNYSREISIKDLATATELSPATLNRRFRHSFGLSPMSWLWSFRVILAAEIISMLPRASLAAIARSCGFTSMAHFSRRFHKTFHEPPLSFQAHFRKRKDVTIFGAIPPQAHDSPLVLRALKKLSIQSKPQYQKSWQQMIDQNEQVS